MNEKKYKYLSLSNNGKKTFFGINNKYLGYNINILIKNKNPKVSYIDFKIIKKGNRKRILVNMKCDCGTLFSKTLDSINRKGRNLCCNTCSKKIRGLKKRGNKEEMFKKIESFGYEILDKNKHYLRNEYIEVINNRGYRGFVKYNYLLQNKQMSIFNEHINLSNYIYNANVYAKENGINCVALRLSDKKKWKRQGIVLQCECGCEFETSLPSFQNGKNRCDRCSQSISKLEVAVANFLTIESIKFIKEFRFNSCRDILPLPFDFYLTNHHKIIEVDGIQHFVPIIGRKNNLKQFEIIKKHDTIKNKYCKDNNIPLLRISYQDIYNNNYKDMIKQFIKN